MSPNETDLRARLHDEAERVDAVGDFASAAIALERRRGHRRAAAIVATAFVAVAAVAVPLGVAHQRGSAPPPSVPASSPNPSPTATRPLVYALDDTIRVGDKVIRLPKWTGVENLAVLSNGGFLLQSHLTVGASTSEMTLLSPGGKVVRQLGSSGFYAVSPDGTRVVAQDGQTMKVVVVSPDGTVLASRPNGGEAVAIVGDHVYLRSSQGTTSVEWNYVTGQTRTLRGSVAAVSADGTRAALQWIADSADGVGSFCWAVADLTDPRFRTLIEQCGSKGNPNQFEPLAFSGDGSYLVGMNNLDTGNENGWLSAAVVRVSDGAMVLGGKGARMVAGWTWRLDDDRTLLISRDPSPPKTTQNTLQRCTLELSCSELGPRLPLLDPSTGAPRYVVPRTVPR